MKELLDRAGAAHESISSEPTAALERAFEAGDALIAAKAQVLAAKWSERLAPTGIPLSTARLYMQLARERARIEAAGCTSIREARRLLAGTKPPRAKRTATSSGAWSTRAVSDRYEEGYADGFAAAQPLRSSNGQLPLDRKDMLWLIKLAHPDMHRGDLRAARVTRWLNELAEHARA